jgi:hypothetical protein
VVAKIYRRTSDGIPFFVDNQAEAPVLVKECQPIASCVLVDSTLAENRDLSFAHPKLNERGLDIEPASYDGCIDAEGPLLKLHYGHGFTVGVKIRARTKAVTVEAEDALLAAPKIKLENPEALLTYIRKSNRRGDRRHPHESLSAIRVSTH